MGGVRLSIVRAWTGEVWVRSTRPWSSGSVQNVSCMVRAGWSGPRLSASKLSHSASMTGPSATSQPMPTKMSAISSEPVVIGCRAPSGRAVGGQGDVDGLLGQHPGLGLGLELGLPGGQRLGHGPARLADPLAGLLAALRRQRADLPVGQGQRRAVAGVLDPDPLQLLEVAGGRDRRERGVARGVDLLGLHGGDLHGVVVGVGSGHGASLGAPAPRRERVPALRRRRAARPAR